MSSSGTAVAPGISFVEYLRELPTERVLERFVSGTSAQRRILSSSALERISRECREPHALVERFEALPDRARELCALAYLFMHSGVDAAEGAGVDDQLLNSFLVHVVRDRDGGLWYRGFAEFEEGLRGVLAPVLSGLTRRQIKRVPAPRQPVQVVNDLVVCTILDTCGDLTVTKTGALAKAAYDRCRALMHCAQPLFKRDMHHTTGLLLEYARARELVANGRMSDDGLREWASMGVAACQQDLQQFCVSRVRQWHWPLAHEAFCVPAEGEAFVAGALGESCQQAVLESLRVGDALGLCGAGKSDGEVVFVARGGADADAADGHDEAAGVTILPDFSGIVPQDASPVALMEFADVGELSSLDQMYHGKVTRQAVADSLHRGAVEAALMERLTRWRAPTNVSTTVREWAREFHRLSLPGERVVLVRDEGLVQQLLSLDSFVEHVSMEQVAAAFRVRPGREREVETLLAGLGFDVRSSMNGRAVAPDGEPEPQTAETGVLADTPRREDPPEVVPEKASKPGAGRRARSNGKYGRELKELPPAEMDHVIDYAIIMGSRIRFEYSGSPGLRGAEYTIVPQSYTAGRDGYVEGEDVRTGTCKKFLRARITAIGVLES